MKNNIQHLLFWETTLILLILCCFSFKLAAEEAINKAEWEKISKNVSYTETFKEHEASNIDLNPTQLPAFDFSILRIVIWVVVIILLLIVLYIGLWNILRGKSLKFKKKTHITFDNFEEHIDEADLDTLLQKALNEKLYFLALRIQYLIVLKSLNKSKLITWKKDKTNGIYLGEMFGNTFYNEFSHLTYVFEKVWYGDIKITQTDYEQLSVPYQMFNQKIRNHDTK